MKTLIPCLSLLFLLPASAKPKDPVWIDPETATKESPEFLIQGEYFKEGAPYAAQVVVVAENKFDCYVLEGGLPGAGWEPGKKREKITGVTGKDGVEFSKSASKLWATIKDSQLTLQIEDQSITLPRIERKSPTLGAKPPEGAVVLFDGSNGDAWKNGVVENGMLKANNTMSKQHFESFQAHIEFRTPFMPYSHSQKRGNSGVYYYGRWETQVLDSFGLSGKQNETGGIYSIAEPRLNMCFPPLTWQTYDVEFTAPKFDEEGKRTAWPRITVRLNGVLVHEDRELGKLRTTASPISGELSPGGGPIFLQDHRNPVYFRNIWVLPK